MRLKNYYLLSESGPFLKYNEDFVFKDLDMFYFSLIDGFGGVKDGPGLSKKTNDLILKFYLNFVEDRNSTMPFYYNFNLDLAFNALVNGITNGHRTLLKENEDKKIEDRFGASCAITIQENSNLYLLFTGNTFGYLVRKGRVIPLYLSDYSMRDYSQENNNCIPLSCLGQFYNLSYSLKEMKILKGDRVFLFSQGVNCRFELDYKMKIMSSSRNIKSVLQELFELSNELGNRFNQSGIALEY